MRLHPTAVRVLRQFRHDPRTLVIVLVIPMLIMTLVHYMFDGREPMVSVLEAQMLVVFPIMIMFLLTAVAMVRERISGTLERLMTTPIRKAEILGGYAMAFGVLASVQACACGFFAHLVLGMETAGPLWQLLVAAIICAQLGVALGLLSSAISRSEFQAVQMFPVILAPQIMLCGLFGPRDQMAGWLTTISDWLPLTYAVEAMDEVLVSREPAGDYWGCLGMVSGCVIVLLALAAITLRRRTA